jgi:transcriptional regulator GlxA family with amidase domain
MILLLADELVDERQASRIGEHLARLIDRRDGSEPLVLGAVGAAAHLMAQQGLLDGYRASIHWQILADAVQTFSRTVFSTNVFEIDRDRVSCAGGTTTLDLLLHWLGLRHGSGFAAELAASLGVERLRNSDERQPLPTSAQPVVGSARIKEALALMEANLSEPLQADDIARLVGVSRRQLERLFRQHLEALPSRYYLELRLKHARRQLKQTTQSILQVGLASGFASGSHFSTAYRNCFGYTPREERARRMMPQAGTNESGENDQ